MAIYRSRGSVDSSRLSTGVFVMTDYRQMQELQEQREQEELSLLIKVDSNGLHAEAEILAAHLGLYQQFKKELKHGTHG
jgi:hypothetical protein